MRKGKGKIKNRKTNTQEKGTVVQRLSGFSHRHHTLDKRTGLTHKLVWVGPSMGQARSSTVHEFQNSS